MRRGSGVLLHITSLPSPYGVGDLGPAAYRFAEFLAEARQSLWQVLPLNPTDPYHNHTPYRSDSAFAGNRLLVSPELLVRDGWLHEAEIRPPEGLPRGRVDYPAAAGFKQKLFDLVYGRFKERGGDPEFEIFSRRNVFWLDDYALFTALRERYDGRIWSEWPEEIRERRPEALAAAREELADAVAREKLVQFLFLKQWTELRAYCNGRGIQILGDVPIYLDYQCADLWARPDLFKLDEQRRPYVVAGVPPDYFSQTGQLWGNPLYQWDAHRGEGFDWWLKRIGHNLEFFDLLRIDHFRGLVDYWEVGAAETTAVNGRWAEGPGERFFNALFRRFPHAPLVAEDLGIITADVREAMRRCRFPGMKVLLFSFGGDQPRNPYTLHNHVRNCVVYTGTHDNNTVVGWFEKEASEEEKGNLDRYLGREVSVAEVNWELIRLALMSVADTAVVQLQDVLGLGEESRMNRPGTLNGNWLWRFKPEQLTGETARKLGELTRLYGRD